jgi:L-fucose mutarotase/ribose pyranase (RbsD/FucU family)
MSYLDDDIITKHNMATIDEIPEALSEYLTKISSNEDEYRMAIEYIEQLEFYDKLALTLSIEILGSSFDLIKSNGFIEWLQTHKKIK